MTGDLRVGVVGVGSMGADHAERLARRTAGAALVAVADPDAARARALAGRHGVEAFADPLRLVGSDTVEAVVIASPGAVHEEQVMACLALGKPVLCEKPLTMDAASSLRLAGAERDAGRPLVQVGFMRRFDPEYAEAKRVLDAGGLGRLLLVHNVHRNRTAPHSGFSSAMIVRDSLVHEVDVARFLFGEEVVEITVLSPTASRHAPAGVVDPQVSVLRMAGGGLVTTEVFINSQVGYDVRCEVVAEQGALSVGSDAGAHADWTTRFARAYDLEVKAWVEAGRRGAVVGATTGDGYAATVVADAGLESLATGRPVPVTLATP